MAECTLTCEHNFERVESLSIHVFRALSGPEITANLIIQLDGAFRLCIP